MNNSRVCVVIPTYNNAATLSGVVQGVAEYTPNIIVVNDGSTDDTAQLLATHFSELCVVTHPRNRGKGAALLSAFKKAQDMGYTHAITIDADGQHAPTDLPLFFKAIRQAPNAIVVGNRFDAGKFSETNNRNMNGQSKFANRFSNFWFALQTGRRLPDTQTGFRAYPLRLLRWLPLVTSRYESELALLVFAAWHNVRTVSIPINVHYPPREERVSHFRPAVDFARISVLNTFLTFFTFFYAIPRKILRVVCTAGVLVLLFVLMFFLQIGMLVYFLSHRVSEAERLGFHALIQRIARTLLRLLPGIKTRFDNPTGEDFMRPSIIVSNHQSHLDLLCILALTPRMVILTKRWVWYNPLYAVAIRFAEYLPVTRNIEDNEKRIANLVKRGYSVMLFPEGTRSASLKVQRFHQGAFYLAQRFQLDIVPVLLYGTGHVLNKRARTLSPGDIVVTTLRRIPLSQFDEGITPRELAKHFRRMYVEELEQD